ncbi:unnamed protein product [Linum trigynum]|uniref:Uncharacterized protein n=1 Tax=Linum trigynum TaxID=586398 RepID=A0AAV2E112_9ROSI
MNLIGDVKIEDHSILEDEGRTGGEEGEGFSGEEDDRGEGDWRQCSFHVQADGLLTLPRVATLQPSWDRVCRAWAHQSWSWTGKGEGCEKVFKEIRRFGGLSKWTFRETSPNKVRSKKRPYLCLGHNVFF